MPLYRVRHTATTPLATTAISSILAASVLLAAGCSGKADANREGDNRFTVQVVGRLGDQPGFFSRPRAVQPLADGGFVVIDRSGRVQRFNPDGTLLKFWRLPAWTNGTPTGFCVDFRDDSLWIADTHYQRILHVSNEGALLAQFGKAGTEPGEMIFPTDCALDPDDFSLWISEYGNRNRIMHYSAEGEFLGEWGGIAETDDDLLRPQSLRVVPGGDLLVCDAGHHRIWKFKRTPGAPEPLGSWGVAGSEPGQLKYPYSIDIAADHSLYIAEFGGSRVSHFTLDGQFLSSWGGPGHESNQLYNPWGLGVDAKANRLLIADTYNNRVLVVSPLP